MFYKFKNNSVSGVNRKYRAFDFELAGSAEKEIDVPAQYEDDLLKYLKLRQPAVSFSPVTKTTKPVAPAEQATPVESEVVVEETPAEEAGVQEEEKGGEDDGKGKKRGMKWRK